jgi:hypothetical protein
LKENLLWVRTFDTIEELRAALVEFAGATTKPGSSPDMDIVPQPKCEPTNVGLIRTQWTIYSWPPEWAQPRVSKPGRSTNKQRDNHAQNDRNSVRGYILR